jgi:site-specific recombinase XerC
MIILPFGCSCSTLSVSPKNWKSKNASVKKTWFVFYRFYDPTFKDNPKYKEGKLVIFKGFNHIKDLAARQNEVRIRIDKEISKLKETAYNPILGREIGINHQIYDIEPTTPFIEALTLVEKRIKASPSTKRDLKSTLRFVTKAAIHLRYNEITIKTISRKHIKQVLSQIDLYYGESSHRYNKIRSYLMMMYKELIELETVEVNPMRDISKKKGVEKLRILPSVETRQLIDGYLKEHQYRLWLFMHIFFHSGARLTEMMQIQRKHVNLDKQSLIVTIKKGTMYKQVEKPIKNNALPFWIEAIENASIDDYIFSKGLRTGKNSIQSFQITKRWNLHVKKKLGVKEDFYSLKHLNLDETASILNINDAAAMASHTSTAITLKHYAVNEKSRQNERLKLVNNKFA